MKDCIKTIWHYTKEDEDFLCDVCFVELFVNDVLFDTFDRGGYGREPRDADAFIEGYISAKPETIVSSTNIADV